MPNTSKRSWTEIQLVDAVANSTSYAGVLRSLNLKPTGGNYSQIKKYIKEYRLEINHFTGQAHNAGKVRPEFWTDVTKKLTKDSNWNTNQLRKQLIRAGIFNHQCNMCKNTEWLGSPIPLELDHIDGDRTNNLLENLRVLCPNCHSLTPTYRGKNITK
jgi:hypothetical protein